jgi:hypothetical protein
MSGFARIWSGEQIATLGAYLMEGHGNPEREVMFAQVCDLRAGGISSSPPTALSGSE